MMRIAILLLPGVLALGCAPRQAPPLVPQVQVGPGADTPAKKVLALPSSCGSVEFECPLEYGAVVDGIVRSTMEFTGYTVVDSSSLRNENRQREEVREREVLTNESASTTEEERVLDFDRTTRSKSNSRSTRTTTVTRLTGSEFDDLSVAERKKVIGDAGADSVLTVRIVVGAQVGVWSPDQSVEVMVRLGVAGGDSMAWASRCAASSNDFSSVNAALENATRCAIYGGTGK